MATLAGTATRRRPVSTLISVRMPLWFAVVCSRVLVIAAGACGAAFTTRVSGWERYDPHRLSTGMGSVGNLLTASMVRWDAVGYITLAEHGYTSKGSTVLFPMYPLLIRAVATVVISPVVAGILISLIAFGIGLALVHRITAEEIGPRAANATVLLLAFSPLSFVFSAVYTESLLLALCAGAFYLARKQRFVLASVLTAAAALTHVDGVLMVPALALMYWKSRGYSRDIRQLLTPSLLALTLPLVGLAGLFTYTHSRGWGWLAPITSQNVTNAGRTLVGPPATLWDSARDVVTGLAQPFHGITGSPFSPGIQNLIYAIVFLIAVLGLISAWRRLPREYALFGVLTILICSSSAVALEPLKGFDRYMLPVFPLWIGIAAWLEQRRLTAHVITISTVMLVFYTVEFVRWFSVF